MLKLFQLLDVMSLVCVFTVGSYCHNSMLLEIVMSCCKVVYLNCLFVCLSILQVKYCLISNYLEKSCLHFCHGCKYYSTSTAQGWFQCDMPSIPTWCSYESLDLQQSANYQISSSLVSYMVNTFIIVGCKLHQALSFSNTRTRKYLNDGTDNWYPYISSFCIPFQSFLSSLWTISIVSCVIYAFVGSPW